MRRDEFDRFADEYREMHATNIRASGETPEYFAEYKIRDVSEATKRSQPERTIKSILDFGAGVGNSVPFWGAYFPRAHTTCLDVSARSLQVGQQQRSSLASFVQFDGRTFPFADGSFDIAFAACVFHHIDAEHHLALLRELRRVIKSNGRLWIFEHNPYNPLTVRAVKDCPFDENAQLISATQMRRKIDQAGYTAARVKFRIFFPAQLRRLRRLESLLVRLPLGAQYSIEAQP